MEELADENDEGETGYSLEFAVSYVYSGLYVIVCIYSDWQVIEIDLMNIVEQKMMQTNSRTEY